MTTLLLHIALFSWIGNGLGAQGTHASTTHASTTAPPAVSLVRDSRPAPATCPSKTINFITHTLAQQCLADRTHHSALQSSTLRIDVPTSMPSSSTSNITVTSTQTTQPSIDTVNPKVSISGEEIGNVTIVASSISTSPQPTPASDDEALKTSADAEDDAESPLDNANFLSFEEWKNQNLAKVGQSPEDIGRGQPIDASRKRPGIENALDTLGEEHEISLDFAGFGGGTPVAVADIHSNRGVARSTDVTVADQQDSTAQSLRSKDAGKTCKERTNYASFDCAATILKSNKECKSASSVLVEHKDSYMLNICAAENKFFIVELCDDIQIDTIVLANYEFFSSSFRHFRVSVSDRYPVKMEKWKDLGTFEARNTREIQAFLIQNPLIWARYLRIEFLSHYGLEYYCPVSVLRVHGTTMWEDYRHQEELARGEIEDVTLEVEALATPPVTQEHAHLPEPTPATLQAISVEEKSDSVSNTVAESTQMSTPVASLPPGEAAQAASPTPVYHGTHETNFNGTVVETESNVTGQANDADAITAPGPIVASPPTRLQELHHPVQNSSHFPGTGVLEKSSAIGSIVMADHATIPSTSLPAALTNSTPVTQDPGSNRTQHVTNITASSNDLGVPVEGNTSANLTSQSISSDNTTRAAASTTSSQPAQPSTQESFFKSFHKRLQQLESNSTLSLQYIEEQSRILRDAFAKVEKRQLAATTKFLSQLNSTVMAELHGFRQSYDQLWQSTVIELEGQRENSQRELLALSSRLTMVADELIWQKRMGIVQSTLLLLCLALAIFTRSENGYLEVPLMQNMMNRSTTALRGRWDSPPNSPSPDSRSPVSLFRRWRASPDIDLSASDTDISRSQSGGKPDITIEAPSPNERNALPRYFDEQDDRESVEKVQNEDKRGSPKRPRKKGKKSHGFPLGNGRAKSPLAM